MGHADVDTAPSGIRWLAYLGWAAAVCLLVAAPLLVGVDPIDLTQDPTSAGNRAGSLKPWTGAWSLLGVIGWALAAGSCLTAGAALWSLDGSAREVARFLLATGVLLGFLGVDDALLLHDAMIPEYLHVPEPVVLLVLGVLVLAYAARFSVQLLAGDRLTLALSVTALGLSAGSDALAAVLYELGGGGGEEPELLPTVVEDGLKLFGLGLLMVWCGERAYTALIEALGVRKPLAGPKTAERRVGAL
jgi:hypothetical protein